MHAHKRPLAMPLDPETATPIFPSAAAWAALDADERLATIVAVNEGLAATGDSAMGDSIRHSTPAREAISHLDHHFRRQHRGVFIAQGLSVCYPDEATFSPDVLAVLDVPLGHRDAWIVEDEGRGLDLALEILVHGDRNKDLVTNVRRFAKLGIPEYFVFDVKRSQLMGYRLVGHPAGANPPAVVRPDRYVPIVPQFGRLPCETLGVELALVQGKLRFYYGGAAIQGPDEEVELLARIVEEREAALREEVERAAAEAERAAAEAERAAAEAQRAEVAEERIAHALAALRGAVAQRLAARGAQLTEAESARLAACEDLLTLADWAARAATASSAAEVFADSR